MINVHASLGKAKRILEKNQYPPSFYDPTIKKTLDSIIGEVKHPTEKSSIQSNTRSGKVALFIQYRGKCTDDYARALHKINASNASCTIIMTLRKLKTLGPPVEKMLKSGLDYRLTCPCCFVCYVGETNRNLGSISRERAQWSYICLSAPPPSLKRTLTYSKRYHAESTTYWHLKPFTSES